MCMVDAFEFFLHVCLTRIDKTVAQYLYHHVTDTTALYTCTCMHSASSHVDIITNYDVIGGQCE